MQVSEVALAVHGSLLQEEPLPQEELEGSMFIDMDSRGVMSDLNAEGKDLLSVDHSQLNASSSRDTQAIGE